MEAGYAALAAGAAAWQALAEVVSPMLARPVPDEPAPPSEERIEMSRLIVASSGSVSDDAAGACIRGGWS
jgi:hypothetical protein